MKRRILFSVMCAVIAASVFAQGQGQGLAGINAATSLMTSYFDPATKLCYAIGAVLGLVGGIKTNPQGPSRRRHSNRAHFLDRRPRHREACARA